MKLRSLITTSAAALALFSGPTAIAQDQAENSWPTPVPAAEAPGLPDDATGVPALWKLADEDTTVYLFGTVHMLPPGVPWNTGPVKDALASSDTLVTEIDITPGAEAEIGEMFQAKGMLPQGATLRGLMNAEQRATYEAGLGKLGMPAEAFDQMEPWLVAIVLGQVVAQGAGFNPEYGVEEVLEQTAPAGIERGALETIEFQVSVFDELPVDQQLLYLLDGAADPLEGIKILNDLVDMWSQGRVEALGELMNDGFESHPNLGERLLYQRNANWAEWIDDRMDAPGTVFIAVGAGHLAGERSVQDYLAERGFETTRVQ